MKKPIMAIMYDFDKTLSTTDMQNYAFIPALGMTPDEFWGATGEFSKKTGCERILSYMWMMIKLSKEKGIQCTQKWLNSLGKEVQYYPGVETWFKRINEYGKSKGVRVEHYLVSSGTKEIIDGTSIAKEFKKIYGCEFYYDPETKLPIWPKFAINYTQKTQYFFRISKGITNKTDDSVNNKTVSRRIPYENMVYLGDGMTDVPCMVLVKQNNGNAIAIYSKKEQGNVSSLLRGGRVNFACLADYSENSDLDKTMKLIIDKISINHTLKCKEEELLKKEMRREKSAK
ncbi:MAG: haloacid dehalogenase-like hydrolase [Bacilli bacterium]|nr:haloacid dehalogenase-like hydrolase [Erysipelotrichaceae bacterium]MDY4819719.1 haloacid dehalogenase-like hydrolase [Bacilli bacterium]